MSKRETHDVSGPIKTPIIDEAIEIQNAPMYDVQQAKELVNKMPEVVKTINAMPEGCIITDVFGNKSLYCFGDIDGSLDLKPISQEISSIENDGHTVSFLMIDIKTLKGVAYNIGWKSCTQSAIKAPYIGSLLESNYELLEKDGQNMHDAIVHSDNDAYLSLFKEYGYEHICNWAQETDVNPELVRVYFPRRVTVRDMAKLWTKMYAFLNSGIDSSNFAKYFAKTRGSAISYELGQEYPIQTKAGWEDVPTSSEDRCACNDCGIIYSESGPYIEIIFTDIVWRIPELNPIRRLVRMLDDIHISI